MSKSDDDDPSVSTPSGDIGRGKPRHHTRFQPGRSGNPKGRPRKPKEPPPPFAHCVFNELNRRVTIVTNEGKRVIKTVAQIIASNQVNAAARGDKQAVRFVLQMLKLFPELVQQYDFSGSAQRFIQRLDEMIAADDEEKIAAVRSSASKR